MRRTRFELTKARDRGHILVGLAIAVVNIDEVIHIIRSSKDPAEARERLVGRDWPVGDMLPLIELIADPRTALIDERATRAADRRAGARHPGADPVAPHRPRPRGDLRRGAGDWPTPSAPTSTCCRRATKIMAVVRAELVEVREAVRRARAAPIIVEGDADARGRGPDRPRGHGDHRHPRRLRQAHAAGHLPHPASRRQRPLGHVDQGGGRGHARVLRLDPRADAVLLLRRQGLQAEGLAPAGRARRPRAARRSSTSSRSSRARP